MMALLLACLAGLSAPAAHAAGQGEITLTVKQVFTNAGASAPPSEVFHYRLAPKLASNPMPAGSAADGYAFAATGTGDASIGPIVFAQAGRYAYEISHVTAARPGYTYDQEVYALEIFVKSDLTTAAVVYKKDGSKASGIKFEHAYSRGPLPSDPGAMADPPVVKTVSGSPARASAFAFRLTAGNPANPMPAGSANGVKALQITGSGRGEFGTWSYTAEGTYYYTVSEVNAGLPGYAYDATVYTITDAVKAVGGQLVVTRVVTNGANKQVASLSFINTYTPGGGEPTSPSDKPKPGPKTGDESQAALYAALFCVAGAAALASLIYLLAGRRRGKETHGHET
jgi:pilin isopeptide linkage protein